MRDGAQGRKSVTHYVARIIAKSAWGRVVAAPESDAAGVPHWILAYDQLAWSKPQLQDGGALPEDLVSYHAYLEEQYPTEGPNAEQNKALFEDRISSFAVQGGAGAKFKHTREKMLKCLSLPKGAKEELNYPQEVVEKILNGQPLWEDAPKNLEDGDEDAEASPKAKKELTQDQKYLLEMFGEGKYHIIPSFFRTLIYLKKQKREFAVAFRTYGSELDKVVWEFNQFCAGQHPCFSGRNGTPMIKFDGSKGTKDLRIQNLAQKGVNYRFSADF